MGVAVSVVITETGLMSTPSSSSTARTVTAWVPAPLNTCVTEQVPATAGTVVPVPSRQSNVQVWVSFAPGSVTVAVKSIALPASTVVLSAGELMVATGGALVTASGAVAVTGALMPSSPVRVRVKVPSSVQVTVVVSELGSAKVQVAPGSTSGPAAAVQVVTTVPVSGSVTCPLRVIGEPSTPWPAAPGSTVGASLMWMTSRETTALAVPPRRSSMVYLKVARPS